MSQKQTVIMGAGIAGLTAGFFLSRGGASVRVLERDRRPGGSILTERKDGYLVELGPNTVLANSVQVDELLAASGMAARRLDALKINKKRYILKDGRLLPLPAGPLQFLTTPIFSARTKLGLFKEPFIGRADREETIAQFVNRRLGPEMLEYAVGPFVSGVYAGDPDKLSVRWAVRKIHALEAQHGSLIRGAIAKQKGPQPRGGLFTFPEGLDEWPKALARAVGSVTYGAAVQRVERDGDGFKVTADIDGTIETFGAGRVILTGNARDVDAVLAPVAPEPALKGMPYAPVAIVALGLDRKAVSHPLDGFGFLLPQTLNSPLLGCLFTSSLFPGRAPEGKVLLTAFLGGARHPEILDWDPASLPGRALETLRPVLGIAGDPEMVLTRVWPEAIPQYNLGHGAFVARAAALEARHPGLHFSGNLLHGVSVADCVTNAALLARTILQA
jgi:oxygen-dependent protoporphyrinogen oxidase